MQGSHKGYGIRHHTGKEQYGVLCSRPRSESWHPRGLVVQLPKGKLLKGLLMRYSGKTGALEEIHEITGACHKRFKTRAQAEAFIEDWKESFADVWRREVRRALDRGLRP